MLSGKHYNLAFHITLLFTLILYVIGRTYSLSRLGRFIYSQSFWQKDVIADNIANKSALYLLDYDIFWALQPSFM